MQTAIAPWSCPSVEVAGTAMVFPVRRIFCVGRNYADHAREMGSDPDREPPFFFMKPAEAVAANGALLPYPPQTRQLEYELELVAALGQGGRNIPVEAALDCVFGYGVGLDMTRRDLQAAAKKTSRPWDLGKAFDNSAPLTAIHPVSRIGHPEANTLSLRVNGVLRQQGNTGQMIWSIAEQIAFLSRYFTLLPGDLVFTGTPAGVGAVGPGDSLEGVVEGVDTLRIRIADPLP